MLLASIRLTNSIANLAMDGLHIPAVMLTDSA